METALLKSIIKPGFRILDVGANIGYYTVLFAEWVGASGSVHAVEPDVDNFELLKANIQYLPPEVSIKLHAVALSHTDGRAQLFRSKDNTGMHRLYDSVCCDGTFSTITTYRGDTLNLAPLDIIKIDVKGYELHVLHGLINTINNSPSIRIFFEFSPLSMLEAGTHPLDFVKWIEENNFFVTAHDCFSWSTLPLFSLTNEVEKLQNLDFNSLKSSLINCTNRIITQTASDAALACSYSRPIIENFLLTKHNSLQHQIHLTANQKYFHRRSNRKLLPISRHIKIMNNSNIIKSAISKDIGTLLLLFEKCFYKSMTPKHWQWINLPIENQYHVINNSTR